MTKLHHSSVGPLFRPTHTCSASLSQGRLLVPVSVVVQGRTTTMLRCTWHVCGSRRSSDGDVQPSQLVPSRKRRHHINPRHIVTGVSWTVFPLTRPLWGNSFQVSSPAPVEPCRVSSVSMSFFRHARVWSRRMSYIMPRSDGLLSSAWSRSLGVRQPFATGRRAPFLQGLFLSTSREPLAQCVPRMQLSRSCTVPSRVCVP